MTIIKIVGIALIGIIIVSLLRASKPEFAVLATIATGIVLVIVLVNSLSGVIVAFENLIDKSGLPSGLFSLVLKIIGIGYLTEYSASICNDAGCSSFATKVQMGGKLLIFGLSIGIITRLVEVISNISLGGV